MKTSELTRAALDWAVCEATGFFKGYTQFRSGKNFLKVYGVARNTHLHPSSDWAQGGPIIEREKIGWFWDAGNEHWCAANPKATFCEDGPTPLVAAMRCFVASKLGDEVEIPEELQ
jgi:hypothetical protein